jgi:hypothetical protein
MRVFTTTKYYAEVTMNKRLSVIMLCVFFTFIFAAAASAKVSIELGGNLFEFINPVDFNKDFSNAFKNVYSGNNSLYMGNKIPGDVDGSHISQTYSGTAAIRVFLGDAIAIKLVGGYSGAQYNDTVSIDSVDCLYSDTILMNAYAGLGLDFYLNIGPSLSLFLGGDGGMFIPMGGYYEFGVVDQAAKTKLTSVGLPYAGVSNSFDFTNSFYGGNIEAGLQCMITDFLGISVHGGYRIAKIPFTYPNQSPFNITDNTAAKNKIFKATTIDMSGPFIGGGLVICFGGGGAAPAAAAAGGAVSKYEQYGDYYYKQKNYSYAQRYYAGALKQSPNAGLYKKIGLCYYFQKNVPKAVENLQKYLEMNPSDEAFKKWVEKIPH